MLVAPGRPSIGAARPDGLRGFVALAAFDLPLGPGAGQGFPNTRHPEGAPYLGATT